jgi:hypothetical protein
MLGDSWIVDVHTLKIILKEGLPDFAAEIDALIHDQASHYLMTCYVLDQGKSR